MTGRGVVAGLAMVLAGWAASTPGFAALSPTEAAAAPRPASSVAQVTAPRLEVHAIEGAAGGMVRADATVRAPRDATSAAVEVQLTAHERTRSRFALEQALSEGPATRPLGSASVSVPALPPAETADASFNVDVADLGLADAADGVYPVTVELTGSVGQRQTSTSAVVVAEAVEQPLHLALVLAADGSLAPEDAAGDSQDGAVRAARRLRRTGGALSALEQPATLALDGRTVSEAVHHDPTVAEALTAADDVAHIARPYANADVVAVRRAGYRDEVARLVDAGRSVTRAHLGADVDGAVLAPAAPLDAETAVLLAAADVRAALLDEANLGLDADRELPRTPDAVRSVAGAGELRVVVPDRWLSQWLEGQRRDPPAMVAQRLLAETAAVYFERPGAGGRGLVVAATDTFGAPLATAVGRRVARAPWLKPVTVPGLLDAVGGDDVVGLSYPSDAREAELPGAHVERVAQARSDLAMVDDVLGGEDGRTQELRRQLDAALSVELRGRGGAPLRQRLVSQVRREVSTVAGAIAITSGPPITLTGIEGVVPVTLANSAEQPLTVRVRLSTTRYDVEDPDGRVVELPPDEVVTETFAVESRAPGGTYPVGVEVVDPSDRMVMADGQVVVRSTAVSTTIVAITVTAGLLLIAWVARDLLRGGIRAGRTADATAGPAHGRAAGDEGAPR